MRASAAKLDRIAARLGLVVVATSPECGIALLQDPSARPVSGVIAVGKADPDVGNIEPNHDVLLPEDPRLAQSTVAILDAVPNSRELIGFYNDSAWDAYVNQYAVPKTRLSQAQTAWGVMGTGTVAIIDTGIDPRHTILANYIQPGYDFTRNTAGVPSEFDDIGVVDQSTVAILDNASAVQVNQSTVAILDSSLMKELAKVKAYGAFGHGTMVAGLVHLAAPRVGIMPLKAFHASGQGSLYDVIRAIYYAVDKGATVINMSFSLESHSNELQAAISHANSRRVLCVASAGNSGKLTVVYPAGYKKVEGIASTGPNDERSAFTNYGGMLVAVAAPGENLITSYPGKNWAMVSGTSFSTALVSGGVALLAQLDRNLNQAQAGDALAQAQPLGPELGAGRVDFFRACQYAATHSGK
ncbi:MAG: S8 family serine peptidase [Bryobacteraceae bacterium]